MILLSIETSCDETALSIVETKGNFPDATYTVLGNVLFSQASLHEEYGGVFPNLAKREHAKRIVPLLKTLLSDADAHLPFKEDIDENHIHELFSHEDGLADDFLSFVKEQKEGARSIDAIAVTHGPGLEPALWVGVNTARALAYTSGLPLIPTHHMEGHIFSSLFEKDTLAPVSFPALALLISGGHTEFVLMREWGSYEVIGMTRDDAVGEAFDKVARMLELPYPGGPQISKHAEILRSKNVASRFALPRPMMHEDSFDMSFSGLKTAVLYALKKEAEITPEVVAHMSRAFEDAVGDVFVAKTKKAIEHFGIRTLILGGGVSANTHIRNTIREMVTRDYPKVHAYLPAPSLTTDNSVMIALAGHAHRDEAVDPDTLRAHGSLPLPHKAKS